MWLLNPYRFGDPDAAAYIAAVEAADGQVLEAAVASAITNFVVGCKTDGTWDALKASCIMAGARTLAGALVPLRGAAPTNFNFVAGDYNRKTGLKGNGINKALSSNYTSLAASADSTHISAFVSEIVADGTYQIIAGGYMGTDLDAFEVSQNSTGKIEGFVRKYLPFSTVAISTGFLAIQRSSSTSVQLRNGGQSYSTTASKPAGTPGNIRIGVFARENNLSGANNFNFRSKARLNFYSIGEAIDLALLDARLATLMNALAAAIP